MKVFFSKLWSEWKELAGYFGDFQSRWLLTLFFFTFALPFGILSRFFMDALQIRRPPLKSGWIQRINNKDTLEASKHLY